MQWVLAHIQPGPHFQEQRKMLRRGIGPQRIGSHNEKIEKHATRLMVALNSFKGSPHELIQRSALTFLAETNGVSDMGIHKFLQRSRSWRCRSCLRREDSQSDWRRAVILERRRNAFIRRKLRQVLACRHLQFPFVDAPFSYQFLFSHVHTVRFIPIWVPGADFRCGRSANTTNLNLIINPRFRKIGNRSSWLNNKIRHVPFEKAKELYVRWLLASPFLLLLISSS